MFTLECRPFNLKPNTSLAKLQQTCHKFINFFYCTAPTIDRVSGDLFEFGGVLTIYGSNFGNISGDVHVALGPTLIPLPVISVSYSDIVCSVPSGKGKDLSILVKVGPQNHSQQVTKDGIFNYYGMTLP